MSPGPPRLAIALLGALAGVGLPDTAVAAPEVEVVVECPLLSDEERAAVEARVRADLMVKQVEPGRMRITCGVDGSTATWDPVERRTVSESGPIVEDAKVSDQLVELVDRVTTRVLVADSTAKPPPVEKTPPASEEPEENSPGQPVIEEDPDEPESEAPPPKPRRWYYDSPDPKSISFVATVGATIGFGPPVGLLPAPRAGAGAAVGDSMVFLAVTDLVLGEEGSRLGAGTEAAWRAYYRIWVEGGLGAAWIVGTDRENRASWPMVAPMGRVRYGLRHRPLELVIGPEIRAFIGSQPDVWIGVAADLRYIL